MKPIRTERGEVRVYEDANEVARAGADEYARTVAGVLADHNRAFVALAGGNTPKAMYKLLATPAWRDRVEWPRIEIFFGDERCVPPDHEESNYRMARQALLDHVPLAAAVHVQKLDSWRVTLTAPVLSAAAHVIFTVVGADKADAFATAMLDPLGTVPVQLVRAPQQLWLVDRAAAQKWLARL